jgi:hypothetical protein
VRVAERSERVCAAVLSSAAAIDRVSPSHRFCIEFGESLAGALRSGMRLDPRTLAFRMRDRSASSPLAEVPAPAWLGAPGLPLIENSASADGDQILTILWAKHLESSLESARGDAAVP